MSINLHQQFGLFAPELVLYFQRMHFYISSLIHLFDLKFRFPGFIKYTLQLLYHNLFWFDNNELLFLHHDCCMQDQILNQVFLMKCSFFSKESSVGEEGSMMRLINAREVQEIH